MNVLMSVTSADLSTTFESAVTNVAMALISFVSAYAIFYINKMSAKLKKEVKLIEDDNQRKLAGEAIERLQSVAYTTVSSIEQTIGATIKKANLSPEDREKQLKELSIRACNEIWKSLEYEYQEALQKTIGDLDIYMVNVIEDNVRRIKNEMK